VQLTMAVVCVQLKGSTLGCQTSTPWQVGNSYISTESFKSKKDHSWAQLQYQTTKL